MESFPVGYACQQLRHNSNNITDIMLCSYYIIPYPPENKPHFFNSGHGPDWGVGLFSIMCNMPRI